jgi:hypothetical protein
MSAGNDRNSHCAKETGTDIVGPQQSPLLQDSIKREFIVVTPSGTGAVLCHRYGFHARQLPYLVEQSAIEEVRVGTVLRGDPEDQQAVGQHAEILGCEVAQSAQQQARGHE